VVADGGGLVTAALVPIEGRRAGGPLPGRCRRPGSRRPPDDPGNDTVNGQPGLVAQQDGVTVTVFAFEVAGDKITHIWAVRKPDKLRPWTTG